MFNFFRLTYVLAASMALSTGTASAQLGGDFGDGYNLGQRNGGILIDRLRQRTVDLEGCGAVARLENSLLRVTQTVRPPFESSGGFVAGFYSGYLNAVRLALATVRTSCGISQYSDGKFAGKFYGEIACQVQAISVDLISSLQIQPLYAGWSGGSNAVQTHCETTLRETIQTCTNGADSTVQIDEAIRVSCSDINP
ncbi:hypothetical protein WDW37_03165 [Bdellovibrionota bacterium FG-1]